MIFDLPTECGRKAVTTWPEKVAAHGDIRANTYKGIVRVVGDASMETQDEKSGLARVSDSRAMTDI